MKPVKEKKQPTFHLDDVEDAHLMANHQKLAKDMTNVVAKKRSSGALPKRNEVAFLQKLVEDTDEVSVNFLIMLLSKAVLSRSEIQLVIDFLLNKQSDTVTSDHSEWTEGKTDVVQKLKKQLTDKEKQLLDEQEAMVAIQAKLKELRQELNSEKSHSSAHLKAYLKEVADKDKTIVQQTAELQMLNSLLAEKQKLLGQMQQLEAKLIQEKNAINAQEHLKQIQQLTDAHNALKNEFEMFKQYAADTQYKHVSI